MLPFLVASCTLSYYHCNAKQHQWKVLKPLYIVHSILGLLVQAQLEHNHRATTFLNMFSRCIQGDPSDTDKILTNLWSGTDVLYRISSPFVKLDYIGRSNSWYRRHSEHKFEVLSPDDANDSLPCYKYIRRNCHWTWFSFRLLPHQMLLYLNRSLLRVLPPN